MAGITLLGSTGSIGKNTLKILAEHPDRFDIVALTAHSQVEELFRQCQEYQPRYAVVTKERDAAELQQRVSASKLAVKVLWGQDALQEVASFSEVDYVMAGIVGAAGLLPTLAAAKAGKRILLANKEALVMSGELFMATVKEHQATLLPVDSEHNALFQCMPPGYETGTKPQGVERIILTASGGPFRKLPLNDFVSITPEQAVAHPNWVMGSKISVDSASMMNKGLEVIEAHWLFQKQLAAIEVIIHPESIIHSMVCYEDGSILAQLGSPDMRIPIAYTLSWPERINIKVKRLNFLELKQLTFEPVDTLRFPCLELAYSALKAGGTAPALLNASNEVAVAAFLEGRIPFTQIVVIISETLEKIAIEPADSLAKILEADRVAREVAQEYVGVSSL